MTNVEASGQDLQFTAGDNESIVKEMAAPVWANDGLAETLTGFGAMEVENEAVAGDDEFMRVEDMAALALSPADDGMAEILASFDAMVEDNTAAANDDELKVGDMAALAENPTGFDAMDEDNNNLDIATIDPNDIWIDGDDASIFCNGVPCMSSSSSSPSTPAAVRPLTTTSSSSTAGSSSSPVAMNSDSTPQRLENGDPASLETPPPLDDDGIDEIIENLECLMPEFFAEQHGAVPPPTEEVVRTPIPEDSNGFARFLQDNRELTGMFLEWCTRNKHEVSAEAVRSIEVKHSIIEEATQRLGTNVEGKKKLLLLILEWAKRRHLHNKRPNPNPNPNPDFVCDPLSPDPIAYCPPASHWLPTPINYSTSPYLSPTAHPVAKGIPYTNSDGGQRLDYAQSWAIMPTMQSKSSRLPDNGNVMNHQPVTLGPSAAKEARRKRIRLNRQRKLKSSQSIPLKLVNGPDPAKAVDVVAKDVPTALKRAASDRPEQQVWRSEKNMMLLMKKVLKQSDVGSLGRIVLPKRQAESYLPHLETKDWITIPIEDIGNSCVWNMRYRYWPNNNSRMYLLENTGDFMKLNGLQEGDVIFLYWDTMRGKYMIRGVKVPEPEKKPVIKKPVIKKPRKKNVRESSLDGSSSSLDPNKKAKK